VSATTEAPVRGRDLRVARKQRGIPQSDLAKVFGLDAATIGKVEREVVTIHQPPLEEIMAAVMAIEAPDSQARSVDLKPKEPWAPIRNAMNAALGGKLRDTIEELRGQGLPVREVTARLTEMTGISVTFMAVYSWIHRWQRDDEADSGALILR
jgi:transcriptional regulator with XRE-family HTH domain